MDTKPTYEELVHVLRSLTNWARVMTNQRVCTDLYTGVSRGGKCLWLRGEDNGGRFTFDDQLAFGWGSDIPDDPPTEWTEFPFPEKDPLPVGE